ncbi:MAG TPA: type II secretion system protein GspL [Burkholderiaceae bacterium]|nr:type II secretion system protein GspL [Burkholderiaceae bacterium]
MLIIQPVNWGSPSPATELNWVQTRDGQTPASQGCDPVALLPTDSDICLVPPVLAASWHRVTLPKIAASRLRQALDGLLEDRVLTDPQQLHFALQPTAHPGQPAWVCACEKALLNGWLQLLDSQQRPANRIVPDQVPQANHVCTALVCAEQAWWVHAGPQGVRPLPMTAPPARATAEHPTTEWLWQTEPVCAAEAEAACGQPVLLETVAQRLLRSAQTGWNLAQFDFKRSAGTRRSQQLGQALRQFAYAPAWAATRWGLLALAATGLLGLGAIAWTEKQALAAKQDSVRALLQQTFPQITLVLDAPVQMQREVDTLQRLQGQTGQADLDVFLTDFNQAAPNGISLTAIQFSATEIQATLSGANDTNLPNLREALQRKGWQSRFAAPVLTLTRRSPNPTGMPARP